MNQDRFDIDIIGNQLLANCRIDGNLKSDRDICLDGIISGNIQCSKRVVVNKGGIIDGDLECEELFLNGKITGNVCVARKTVMGVNAIIEGGLTTDSLEITPGAKIGGGLRLKKA